MGSGISFENGKGWSKCFYNDWTMWDDRREILKNKLDKWTARQEKNNRWVLWERGLDDDEYYWAFDSPAIMAKSYFLHNYQRADMQKHFLVIARPQSITTDNMWDEKTIPLAPVNKGFCERLHIFMKPYSRDGVIEKSYAESCEPSYQYTKKYSEFPETLRTKFGNFSINRKDIWENNCICDLCNHKAGLHNHCDLIGLHKGDYIEGMYENPMRRYQLTNRAIYHHQTGEVQS
jgi:hypothetical protein|tara:strand:- start:145 stop:843 length:699 start_codon:yes stop_codon:yes gene_type:complete